MDKEQGEREYKERQCRLFLRTVANLPPALAVDGESERQEGAEQGDVERQGDLFLALVDRVVVGDGLTFILRDGTEWER